jgi:hypothetical protein
MPDIRHLMILILKSTQSLGVIVECIGERKRFGRRSLGADPRDISPAVEPFLSPKRRKTTDAVEELSVPLSICPRCRARVQW